MILVVGDGPRDSVALPILVQKLLNKKVPFLFVDWHNYSHLVGKGKGTIYSKKVKYFTRVAKDRVCFALVVVTDSDRQEYGEKLSQLKDGRNEERQSNAPFPTALGEAHPHFDVWLLDDCHAVATALSLPPSKIPNIRKCQSPKDSLTELVDESDVVGDVSDSLARIAEVVELNRCPHSRETGYHDFSLELKNELGPHLAD
jgi:hypothetical protein